PLAEAVEFLRENNRWKQRLGSEDSQLKERLAAEIQLLWPDAEVSITDAGLWWERPRRASASPYEKVHKKRAQKIERLLDNGLSRDSRATWFQDGHPCAFQFGESYQYICGDFGCAAQPQQGELHFSAAGVALLIHRLLELQHGGFPALGAVSSLLAPR